MAQIIWTEPALSDLDDIAGYITLDNFTAAEKLVRRVFSIVERLEQFPKSGRTPPELTDSLCREIVVEPCRVFYRYDKSKNEVYILHIIRTESQFRNYLIDEQSNK